LTRAQKISDPDRLVQALRVPHRGMFVHVGSEHSLCVGKGRSAIGDDPANAPQPWIDLVVAGNVTPDQGGQSIGDVMGKIVKVVARVRSRHEIERSPQV
jgi:hypothetical protein